jgi:hypothetical protein
LFGDNVPVGSNLSISDNEIGERGRKWMRQVTNVSALDASLAVFYLASC